MIVCMRSLPHNEELLLMSNGKPSPSALIAKAVSISNSRLPPAVRLAVITKKQASEMTASAFKDALGKMKRGR